jgi:polyisoprenoid-binding protein YceI
MMRTAFVLLFAGVLACAGTYEFQPNSEAFFRLEVQKTGLMKGRKHVFLFSRYSGTMSYDPTSIGSAHVKLALESASIRCQDQWVSAKDFRKIQQYAERNMLAVDQHSHITFSSTSIAAARGDRFRVRGTLTIRSISHPTDLIVSLEPTDGQSYWAQGSASVKLTDYGLTPPSAALGTIGTKDEMTVIFRLKLVPAAVPSAKS